MEMPTQSGTEYADGRAGGESVGMRACGLVRARTGCPSSTKGVTRTQTV